MATASKLLGYSSSDGKQRVCSNEAETVTTNGYIVKCYPGCVE